MATITVRIDDESRDAIQLRAAQDGVSMSDFVRDLIREEVTDLRSDDRRDEYIPHTLSNKDRHVFALLHRILARVLPEGASDSDDDAEHQLGLAHVLEQGFTQEYWAEFAGLSPELSKRDSERVMDILEMFRAADRGLAQLEKLGTPVDEGLARALRYRGFDHNDSLERKMADYVEHLVRDGRWTERADFVNGSTGGNSHSKVLATYLRMLGEYRRIMARRGPELGRDAGLLTENDLKAIAAERIHPQNR